MFITNHQPGKKRKFHNEIIQSPNFTLCKTLRGNPDKSTFKLHPNLTLTWPENISIQWPIKTNLKHPKYSKLRKCFQIVAGICRIPLDVQFLDLIEKAEQKEDWFLKINPKHQIPVLSIDENTHLTESVVISQYLCRQGGHWGRAIYPSEFTSPNQAIYTKI